MMGFTSVDRSMFSKDMRQTPENVRRVLDITGWTCTEAAGEINVLYAVMFSALNGGRPLSDGLWRLLLDKAGRRAFDADEHTA